MENVKKVLVRMPEQLYNDLNTLAKDECRSLNGQIEYFLTLAVKERRKRGFLGPIRKRKDSDKDALRNEFVVRKATEEDLEEVIGIYAKARQFMYEHNNYDEWPDDSYPSRNLLEYDIKQNRLNLIVERDDPTDILAVFVTVINTANDYEDIEGAWLSTEPAVSIHRIASTFKKKGMVRVVTDYCLTLGRILKMNIFADNDIMQEILPKLGFVRCGNIVSQNRAWMIGYQLVASQEPVVKR